MGTVVEKLKLDKYDPVLIINPPEEFKSTMKEIRSVIHTEIKQKYGFIMAFAPDLAQARKVAGAAVEALEGDGYLWLCYPKGTSKKYKSDLNREKVWEIFAPFDFEAVTQVAIDDDWSALRVRYVDNIKSMNRKTAASEKGKQRINGKAE